MKLPVIDAEIELCKNHLENTKTKGTEIEPMITKHLLVHICGEYEKEIKNMIIQRVAVMTTDEKITSFVEKTIKYFRCLKIKDIKGLLGRFSESYKDAFSCKIDDTEFMDRFGNIVANRDLAAHGGNINTTFDEVVESYAKAEPVLDAIRESLEIK
ncbi:MAG: HEPN domain-containing protein [Candidatus Aenigmatarchaeota archaeon]